MFNHYLDDFSPPTQEDSSLSKKKPSGRGDQKNENGCKGKTSENTCNDEGNSEDSSKRKQESEYEEIGQPSPATQAERIYHFLEEEEREGNLHSILNQPEHYSVLWAEQDLPGEDEYSTLKYN